MILIHVSTLVFSQTQPTAYNLSSSPYFLGNWSSGSAAGTYPAGMVFQEYMPEQEPGVASEPVRDWQCVYNIGSRSRFEGLGEWGIGMVNTGSEQDDADRCGNGNELGGKVGVVVFALNTLDMQDIELSWKVRLIETGNGFPVPREYRVMAQYRVGTTGSWTDFPLTSVYSTSGKETGSFQEFTVNLPAACENQSYVQIRWKYYQENSNQGGTRPFVALDDIKVLGLNINTGYTPYVFIGSESLGNFGCIQGTSSQVDSILVSGINLPGNLTVTSSGNFYISTDKSDVNAKSLTLNVSSGNLNERYIYIRKECLNTSVENGTLRFVSGSYLRTFALRGEGYHQVYINEIVASNFISYYDRTSDDYPDWIELYNPNDATVDLAGYYLSDNVLQPAKSQIRSSSANRIGAKGFQVYIADGNASRSVLHLNFSLSAQGETVLLVGKDGKTIIDSITYRDNLKADYSYGRTSDGGEEWAIFEKSTPLESNLNSRPVTGMSEAPVFSHVSGRYDETFLLSIAATSPDAKIYYTLDGSVPSADNLGGYVYEYKQSYPRTQTSQLGSSYYRPYRSYMYYDNIDLNNYRDKSFWISDINGTYSAMTYISRVKRDHATVVRAIAVEPGKAPSEIVTKTFFFSNEDPVKDELPVISIALNENQWKGYYEGIGVAGLDYDSWRVRADAIASNASPANYKRSGRTSEIPANIEIFEDGVIKYSQLVGVRVHGGHSRAFRHKSLRLYSRNFYGTEQMTYPFFKNLSYEDFSRVILRNSGNDFSRTFFKDAFIQRLMRFVRMDYQEYQPYNIYINGEYWGMLNARERIDVNYFNRKYGFDVDDIDFLQNNREVMEGDNIRYSEFMSYLENNDLNSDNVYKEINTRMDVENYIDYQSIKIFTGETDWPNNNIRYWRYRADRYNSRAPYGLDGRWRWVNFDNDGGFALRNVDLNSFDRALSLYAPGASGGEVPEWWASFLFRSLMKNSTFKLHLITRFSDLLNTAFRPERVITDIDWHKSLIEHDMYNYVDRWEVPRTMNIWLAYVEELKTFANQRPDNCRKHMRTQFGLNDVSDVTLSVDDYAKGHIKINTIEIEENTPGVNAGKVYPWTGKYFRELPVTLIPVPHVGYKFSYWELKDSLSYRDTLSFALSGPVAVKAYFEIDENYKYSPEPAIIDDCPYEFTEWFSNQMAGNEPANMAFYYTTFPDSRANGTLEGKLDSIRYDHDSRTRINGLGRNGISLINTAGANENYYETRLGAVAIAVNTENILAADVSFKAGTITPQSKKYSIRLQYRLSDRGEVFDFYDKDGNLVEYHGSTERGDEQIFHQIEFPDALLKQKYVQLIWRYYYNGQHIDLSTNARDELRIDDIVIRQKDIVGIKPAGEYTSKITANPNSNFFQWYKCENDSLILLENETKQELLITAPGTYAVAVDYGMCAHVSGCSYFFVKQHINFAPSIFSQILPNPTNGVFELIFDESMQDVTVSMLDMAGNVVNVRNYAETQKISFDVRKFAKGIYVLDISTRDGRKASQKVVIQ